MIDKGNIYNTIIEHIEDNYQFLTNNEKRAFIIGYVLALKDNKTISNEEIISLITEMLLLDFC